MFGTLIFNVNNKTIKLVENCTFRFWYYCFINFCILCTGWGLLAHYFRLPLSTCNLSFLLNSYTPSSSDGDRDNPLLVVPLKFFLSTFKRLFSQILFFFLFTNAVVRLFLSWLLRA